MCRANLGEGFVMSRRWNWLMVIVITVVCCSDGCWGWHAHSYMSASQLHGLFASAAWASSMHEAPCKIVIEDNVYIDADVLKPLTVFDHSCTLRGAKSSVALMFPQLEPMLLMQGNGTIRFENLIMRHELPVSLMAMFHGIVDLGPGSRIEVENVTLSMQAKSQEWLQQELNSLGNPGMQAIIEKSPEGDVLLKRFTRGSLSLKDVKAAVEDFDELHEWPSPAQYIVDNAAMLVHRLQEAEEEAEGWMGSNPVEISVKGVIHLTANDLPGGRPLKIRRKVAIVGVDGDAVLKLGFNLIKYNFLTLQGNGCVVAKDLTIEFFSYSEREEISNQEMRCSMCNIITSEESPIGFHNTNGLCHLISINTVLRTDCASVKELDQVLQVAETVDSPLMTKQVGQRDDTTVQIEGWKGYGACMIQTKATCLLALDPSAEGAEPAYADQEYVKQLYAEAMSGTADENNAEKNDHEGSKKGIFERYGLAILGILIGANLVLVGTVAWSKWGWGRCSGDTKKHKPELPLGVAPLASSMVTINPVGDSCCMGVNFEGIRSDSTLTADTGQELLHRIHEERRGIGDETMELQEQVGSGKLIAECVQDLLPSLFNRW